MEILYLAIAASIVGLVFASITTRALLSEDEGDETMRSIGQSIQEGAAAFLKREYTFLAIFVIAIAVVLTIFVDLDALDKFGKAEGKLTDLPRTGISYIIGALASATAGYIGMYVAVRANV